VAKAFRLRKEDLRPLVSDGRGCIATDRITVDGRPVGYCYREQASRDVDSGWRFFAGDETQAYLDDPGNSSVYALNTIANYDPGIILLLDATIGSAFERDDHGDFVSVPRDEQED
jgi:hypothetical protein